MNSDCIFCKIIKKELSAKIINETRNILVFNDINPQAEKHLLLIPKIHIASTLDINRKNIHYYSEMLLMAKDIVKSDRDYDNNFKLLINTGLEAGQTVFHFHMHLLYGKIF